MDDREYLKMLSQLFLEVATAYTLVLDRRGYLARGKLCGEQDHFLYRIERGLSDVVVDLGEKIETLKKATCQNEDAQSIPFRKWRRRPPEGDEYA